MLAIKNARLKIFFPTFLLLTFFSCEQKNKAPAKAETSNAITFIGVSEVGGKSGNYRIVKISQDSVKLEQGSTVSQKHRQWTSGISKEDWKNLTASFDIRTLDKITSSESLQAQGGTDETFQIKTSKRSHVFVNSNHDSIHYRQFEKFKSQLDKILPKEYQ